MQARRARRVPDRAHARGRVGTPASGLIESETESLPFFTPFSEPGGGFGRSQHQNRVKYELRDVVVGEPRHLGVARYAIIDSTWPPAGGRPHIESSKTHRPTHVSSMTSREGNAMKANESTTHIGSITLHAEPRACRGSRSTSACSTKAPMRLFRCSSA